MLRIRDVFPGSRIRIFTSRSRTRIQKEPDPGSATKNLSIFKSKIDLGDLFRGSRGQKSNGSQIPDPQILNTVADTAPPAVSVN
jgi:hypothetical protein